MKIWARRPSALISATWTPDQLAFVFAFVFTVVFAFIFVFTIVFAFVYLDELAPLVLFHIQIESL